MSEISRAVGAATVEREALVLLGEREHGEDVVAVGGQFGRDTGRTELGHGLRTGDVLEQFAKSLRGELDFRREMDAMEEMALLVHDRSPVRIPRVYRHLCTRRLLVQELTDQLGKGSLPGLEDRRRSLDGAMGRLSVEALPGRHADQDHAPERGDEERPAPRVVHVELPESAEERAEDPLVVR